MKGIIVNSLSRPQRLTAVLTRSGFDIDNLGPQTRLKEDLDIDSTELMEIVVSIESEFGISVPDSELPRLTTMGDLERLVESVPTAQTQGA